LGKSLRKKFCHHLQALRGGLRRGRREVAPKKRKKGENEELLLGWAPKETSWEGLLLHSLGGGKYRWLRKYRGHAEVEALSRIPCCPDHKNER